MLCAAPHHVGTMTVAHKKWIVGLDLRPKSQGAMRWAAWMATSCAAGDERLVGVHILEEHHLRAALRYHSLNELVDSATEASSELLRELGIRDAFSEVHVLQGDSAEEALPVAAAYHQCDGMILGRQALREGRYVNRLGRVARRVLRALPRPVIVVPPDFEEPPSDAPIVAACNLDDDSNSAVMFAADMSRRLQRRLVLVHAVPLPDDYGARILSATALEALRKEHQEEGEAQLQAWAKARGIEATTVVVQGGVVHSLVEAAKAHRAALLVTGSRKLTAFERVFLTSTGTQTAALAECAVAVVPPE